MDRPVNDLYNNRIIMFLLIFLDKILVLIKCANIKTTQLRDEEWFILDEEWFILDGEWMILPPHETSLFILKVSAKRIQH